MAKPPVPEKNAKAITLAFLIAGAVLAVLGCINLLGGFSVGSIGMLMLGAGLCVLGLVRWKVYGDAERSSRTPMR